MSLNYTVMLHNSIVCIVECFVILEIRAVREYAGLYSYLLLFWNNYILDSANTIRDKNVISWSLLTTLH